MPTAQSTSEGGPSEQAATPEDRLVPALLKWEVLEVGGEVLEVGGHPDGASNSESAEQYTEYDFSSHSGRSRTLWKIKNNVLPLITPATAAGVGQVCTLVWARASPPSAPNALTHLLARSPCPKFALAVCTGWKPAAAHRRKDSWGGRGGGGTT